MTAIGRRFTDFLIQNFKQVSSSIERTYPKGRRGCNLANLDFDVNWLIINEFHLDCLFRFNTLV